MGTWGESEIKYTKVFEKQKVLSQFNFARKKSGSQHFPVPAESPDVVSPACQCKLATSRPLTCHHLLPQIALSNRRRLHEKAGTQAISRNVINGKRSSSCSKDGRGTPGPILARKGTNGPSRREGGLEAVYDTGAPGGKDNRRSKRRHQTLKKRARKGTRFKNR